MDLREAIEMAGEELEDLEPNEETQAAEPEIETNSEPGPGSKDASPDASREVVEDVEDHADKGSGLFNRDDKGRFKKHAEAELVKAQESQGSQDESAKSEGEGKEADAGQSAPAIEPHPSLGAEEKAAFEKWPRDLQEYANRRAVEVARQTSKTGQEVGSLRQYRESIDAVMQPYRPQFAQLGMSDADVVKHALDDMLALANPQTRLSRLSQIAASNGVTAQQLAEYAQQQPQKDPALLQAQTAQQIQGRQMQAMRQQQTQAANGAVDRIVENVRTEVGPDEMAKRPHFDAVQADIFALLQDDQGRLKPEVMQSEMALYQAISSAYETIMQEPEKYPSARAHEPIFQSLLQKQMEAKQVADLEERRQRTANARRAANSVNGAPTVGDTGGVATKGLRSAIERAGSELGYS